MPYFNFDLVIGAEFKNQGGMILENTEKDANYGEGISSVGSDLLSWGQPVRPLRD
jgi:hypothetical protein